ncbi:MAG: hypothetical protein CMJ44_13295 [Pimelobacter sp.]|nr:hypothetical protein [Pimelobacter sp.]
MGLIRKTASLFSLGAVDLRSDRERIARNTRRTLHEQRSSNRQARREAGRSAWEADAEARYGSLTDSERLGIRQARQRASEAEYERLTGRPFHEPPGG